LIKILEIANAAFVIESLQRSNMVTVPVSIWFGARQLRKSQPKFHHDRQIATTVVPISAPGAV
jgi:hypothetical protein